MQQGVGDIKKRGIAERGQVGTVRDQKEAEDEKPLGCARKALIAAFHLIELVSPVYRPRTTNELKPRASVFSA